MGTEQEARTGQAEDAKKTQDQMNATDESTSSNSGPRPSLLQRASFESTATTLPPYSEQPVQPPSYSQSGAPSKKRLTVADFVPHATPSSASSNQRHGVSAASVSAVMASSSSENDKMHSKRSSQKVDDWNEDPTFRARLAKLNNGSKRNWNYFGADIEQYGNPFGRFGRKK